MRRTVLSVVWLSLLCLLLPQLTHAASDSRRIIPTGARGQGQGERRVALIIGNAAYQDASARLQNPVNDARSMEEILQKSGFEVITRTNTDRRTLYAAVKEFGQKLKKSDVGLFYYAGHGVQIDSANYLLPVDLKLGDLSDGDDLKRDAYPLAELLDRMREANTRNIVILDACRDNPFSAKGGRSSSRGLAKIATPPETAILYATDFGNTAADGAGSDNGVFTRNLVQAIGNGLELVELMRQVQGGVRKDTGGKQKPIFDGLLSVSFYFNAPVTVPVAPAVSHAADAEKAAWQAIESSADPSDFRDFLKEYPSGSYAGAARLKLKQLEKKQSATAASRTEQDRLTSEKAEAERKAHEAEERASAAEHYAAEQRSRAETASRSAKLGIISTFFGIAPTITTRNEVEHKITSDSLRVMGKKIGSSPSEISFECGRITFKNELIYSIHYWGKERLPFDFSTNDLLKVADKKAKKEFYWLGTMSFRGLVYSNIEDGPILIEISMDFDHGVSTNYKFFGNI